MAAAARTPIDAQTWRDVPELARPDRAIVFRDDKWVTRIEAERLAVGTEGPRYELSVGPIGSKR